MMAVSRASTARVNDLRTRSSSLNLEHPGQTAHPATDALGHLAAAQSGRFDSTEWQEHVHPNGIVYYFNPQRRVTTNVDLRKADPTQQYLDPLRRVNAAVQALGDWLPPREWEVLVEDEGLTWIDHSSEAASEIDQSARDFEASLQLAAGAPNFSMAGNSQFMNEFRSAVQISVLGFHPGISESCCP